MKIYFDDPEYDGQFFRTVGYAPAGAQIGEAWVIAAQIKAGDATSWYNAWSSYAMKKNVGRSPVREALRSEFIDHKPLMIDGSGPLS